MPMRDASHPVRMPLRPLPLRSSAANRRQPDARLAAWGKEAEISSCERMSGPAGLRLAAEVAKVGLKRKLARLMEDWAEDDV